MTRRTSIIRAALGLKTDRNDWLSSDEPGAQFARLTIANAMTGEATLQQLLDVVQVAFDAGRAAEANALGCRLHADTRFPLTRSN